MNATPAAPAAPEESRCPKSNPSRRNPCHHRCRCRCHCHCRCRCIVTTYAARISAFIVIFASPVAALAEATSSPPHETIERAKALALVLWAVLLLTIVFLTGVFVLRALQRARQRMASKRPEPTEYTDAWSMHRIPEDVLGDHPPHPPAPPDPRPPTDPPPPTAPPTKE